MFEKNWKKLDDVNPSPTPSSGVTGDINNQPRVRASPHGGTGGGLSV